MEDSYPPQTGFPPARQSSCGVAPGPPPPHDAEAYGAPRWFHAPPPGTFFGGSCFPPPFAFDSSIPPPAFAGPPPGPSSASPALSALCGGSGASSFLGFPPRLDAAPPWFDGRSSVAAPPRGWDGGSEAPAEDQEVQQKRRDQGWISRFLQDRRKTPSGPRSRRSRRFPLAELRGVLYGAAALVSRLEQLCLRLQGEAGWTDSYPEAVGVQRELQDSMALLTDPEYLTRMKAKVFRVSQRRVRLLKARKLQKLEQKEAEEGSRRKEAGIDEWRLRQIQQGEEKKKEQELKLAADAVLCEVKKKQADVKRMQDVLRSLEKLRKLRKEAAFRKGISTEQQCDQVFSCSLEQLRRVMKRRGTLYSAEEKALMVMLEGEQEEERKREREKRLKKERERSLQARGRVDAMLFGEEPPADGALQPFRDLHSQAECSFQALIHIRSQWDLFLVSADDHKGSSLPRSWVMPEPPSDQNWASALQSPNPE